MLFNKKIKVLIVDDSSLFREVISNGLESDTNIEVVAKAVDAYAAEGMIGRLRPDVLVCDVQMPGMSGIEFIRRLLPKYPIPVVVVSMVSSAVFDAMDAGAIDFVGKPDVNSDYSVNEFIEELIEKVKIASRVNIKKQLNNKGQTISNLAKPYMDIATDKIIAIGSSTGGIDALTKVLSPLQTNLPGIVIVQHIQANFSASFAERLNGILPHKIKEAETGDLVEPGTVLIAPGGRHMRVRRRGDDHVVECFDGKKINRHRPSVDVLFESVAEAYGENSIGVILTGMGDDGAKGLLAMRKKGARTIGQDKESSVVYGMPKVAYNLGAVEHQVSLKRIPQTITSILQEWEDIRRHG